MMKVKVNKKTHYSVIFMRDDNEVKSFRIRNTVLRWYLILFILFLLVGVGGIVLGGHFLLKNRELEATLETTGKELASLRQKLQIAKNLGSVESLIGKRSLLTPHAKNEQIVAAGRYNSSNKAKSNQEPKPSGKVFTNATNVLGKVNGTTTLSVVNKNATIRNGTLTNATLPLVNSSGSPVRISNFRAYFSRQTTLRLGYELTTQSQQLVKGKMQYALLLSNGTIEPISPSTSDDHFFSIRSFKRFDIVSSIPATISRKDIRKLRIFVQIEEGNRYQEDFNFPLR